MTSPTTRGRAFRLGGIGRFGAALHATCRHSLLGYEAEASLRRQRNLRQQRANRHGAATPPGDRFSFVGACAQSALQAIHINPTHSKDSRTVLFMDPPLGFNSDRETRTPLAGVMNPIPAEEVTRETNSFDPLGSNFKQTPSQSADKT